MAAVGVIAPARTAAPVLHWRQWSRASLYMLGLGSFFWLSYGFASWVTAQRPHVPSLVFAWEWYVPFLAWTIVPYWSIDLFYCLSFFVCRSRAELGQHAKRLFMAQVISIAGFLLFPLRFSFERPVVHSAFGSMFEALASFDGPFNQAPSLHLSLAVILSSRFSARLQGLPRWLLHGWFVLIGASALTTYQHHFIDIATGIWVGALCCWAFPDQPKAQLEPGNRSLKLSVFYLAASVLLGGLAVLLDGWAWWLLWPAGACGIVAVIYGTGDPALFRKKRDGALSRAIQVLLAPYVAAAWLNSRLWTRNEPLAVEIADGVWIGRLPTRAERDAIGVRSIVDLTAELPLNARGIEYRNVPVLDLTLPSACQTEQAVIAIEELRNVRPTLVSCALGYSRSAAAVAAWLMATVRVDSVDEAIALILARTRPRGKSIALTAEHRTRLRDWAGARRCT